MAIHYRVKDDFLKYFVSEVISSSALEEAISWIKSNLEPEEVFDKNQLEEWAKTNGYVKE